MSARKTIGNSGRRLDGGRWRAAPMAHAPPTEMSFGEEVMKEPVNADEWTDNRIKNDMDDVP